jgi:glycosyltransferase involved in cell wall biosynthesis
MPKVLVFKETLLPPSETFILSQVCALTRFTPKMIGLEPARASLRLPEESILLSKTLSSLSQLRAKVYRRTGVAPSFHRQARRFGPDLIHAHFGHGGKSALYLARALGIPLVTTLHGADVTVRNRFPSLYKELIEEGALFLCDSSYLRDCAIALGFPTDKLLVHYIGVDRKQFVRGSSRSAGDDILFVGRLVEKKGCEYLLRAIQLVQHRVSRSDVTIIGDGPLRPHLEALARELGVHCHFAGLQPATVIRQRLQETRIFCAPSVTAENGDSEGLGIVFAEAQAMGVPVVSSLHGGIPEVVVNGKTGILVPERDHIALADAITTLLRDRDLWQSFHMAAPIHIQDKFDLEKQTALLERRYESVLPH